MTNKTKDIRTQDISMTVIQNGNNNQSIGYVGTVSNHYNNDSWYAVDPVTVKIRYSGGTKHLKKISKGDWIDLRAAETVHLRQGEYKLIDLGIAMQLPEGYEAIVAPRSSTFKNFGILMANGIGIIDNSYNGDSDIWKFPAYAVRDTDICAGDRICQFRIQQKQPQIVFREVNALGNASRGGFGSTGTR